MGGTQFAPGQWAGIVLDEPIGKNDGSVAGVRYFQCEDGRGIFTRPSKLSKTPLPEKETNGRQSSPAPEVGATSQPPPAGTTLTGEDNFSVFIRFFRILKDTPVFVQFTAAASRQVPRFAACPVSRCPTCQTRMQTRR